MYYDPASPWKQSQYTHSSTLWMCERGKSLALTLEAEALRVHFFHRGHQLHPQTQLPISLLYRVFSTVPWNNGAGCHRCISGDIGHCVWLFRKGRDLCRKKNIATTSYLEKWWAASGFSSLLNPPMGVLCLSVCFSWLIRGGVTPTTGPISSPSLGSVKWKEISEVGKQNWN